MNRNVIECRDLAHHYGTRCIYEDLNFDVPEGTILGLLGKNGTGKTTLINILTGYLNPTHGNCRIFGEPVERISYVTKSRIGLLLEGHIQYNYFTVDEIERFYSRFFKCWNRGAYYELLKKLKVAPKQKISTMSCGQRSQIALGLLFAQDPDLLILDDFSMGLDPGYRRLFVEYLKEYVSVGKKTVFLTSHIIQDMEKLIDDCIILDYGKILLHSDTKTIINNFRRFRFLCDRETLSLPKDMWNTEKIGNKWESYSFLSLEKVKEILGEFNVQEIDEERLSLEDAFIGLTGKY